MVNITQPVELHFDVNGIAFSAQAWGDPAATPVLALHGWLDNSASFFLLGPQLKNIYLVALDMAGHGRSSHRPGTSAYNIWEDIAEIFAIADQLGWHQFSLLGHSRGGIIAALAAGTFPERIVHLGLIEGLFPEDVRSEDAPKQLAQSIIAVKAQSLKTRTIYRNIASAIVAREHGMFPLGYDAAKSLTERGLINIGNGLQWSTDPRLLVPSAVKLLPEQMAAFIKNIIAPIKLILARDGLSKAHPRYFTETLLYPKIEVVMLDGAHHLHMEKEADAVANEFNTFFIQ